MSKKPEEQSMAQQHDMPESTSESDLFDGPDADADREDDIPPDEHPDSVAVEEAGVESLRDQLQEAQERALRLSAELENYRKRSLRTLEEERRYAALPLMRDLLTVVDNLQRAIQAARDNDSSAGLLEGVEMVAEQLIGILKQHHCAEITAEGEVFDPHLHEAIAQFPSEEVEPGRISQVTQTGYQLHDRVIRPSQVIVAAGKAEEPEQAE
jgi:molecular chaperone GrpE